MLCPPDFLKTTWGESFYIENDNHDIVGHVALMHAWDGSIVIWQLEIFKDYLRKGYALKTILSLRKKYFHKSFKAAVNIKNTASMNLFLKAGFKDTKKVEHNNEQQIWYSQDSFKDNPVPSLDKNDLKLLDCALRSGGGCCGGESPDCAPSPSITEVHNKIKLILQNGVETDKIQPTQNPITFNDFINNNHCKTHWYVLMCNKCRKDFDRLKRQSEL